jgi:hypothetical protein
LEGSDLFDDDQGSPRRTRLRLANRRHLRLALATLEFRGHLPQPLDRLWEGMAFSRAVSLRTRRKAKLKPHSLSRLQSPISRITHNLFSRAITSTEYAVFSSCDLLILAFDPQSKGSPSIKCRKLLKGNAMDYN